MSVSISGYLSFLISPDVLEGADLASGFPCPPPLSYKEYLQYIEDVTPVESPVLYGLHPNAEINFRTVQGDTLFKVINELASAGGGGAGGGAAEKVRQTLDEITGVRWNRLVVVLKRHYLRVSLRDAEKDVGACGACGGGGCNRPSQCCRWRSKVAACRSPHPSLLSLSLSVKLSLSLSLPPSLIPHL